RRAGAGDRDVLLARHRLPLVQPHRLRRVRRPEPGAAGHPASTRRLEHSKTTVFDNGHKTLITAAINAHVMARVEEFVRNYDRLYRLTACSARRAFARSYPDARSYSWVFKCLVPLVHRYKYFGGAKGFCDGV